MPVKKGTTSTARVLTSEESLSMLVMKEKQKRELEEAKEKGERRKKESKRRREQKEGWRKSTQSWRKEKRTREKAEAQADKEVHFSYINKTIPSLILQKMEYKATRSLVTSAPYALAYTKMVSQLQANLKKLGVILLTLNFQFILTFTHTWSLFINTRRMRARVTVLTLCVCVCLFQEGACNLSRMHGCHRNTNSFRKNFHKWKVLNNYVTRRDGIQ